MAKKMKLHYEVYGKKEEGSKHEGKESKRMEKAEHANVKALVKKAKKGVVKMASRIK